MSRGITFSGFGYGMSLGPGAFALSGQQMSFAGTSGGSIAINSSGLFVNGAGVAFQPRGSAMFGLEGQLFVQGWFNNNNPWGSLAGPGGPSWPAYKTWKPNCVRIPLCPALFFNLALGVLTGGSASAAGWSGTTVAADPNGTYKPAIIATIQGARSAGCTGIWFDVHWAAPKFTLGGVTQYMGPIDQPAFMDYDTTYPFWTAGVGAGPTDANGSATTGFVAWLQQEFGPGGPYYDPLHGGTTGINDIVFELFNEPYFDQMVANYNTAYNGTGSTQTDYQVMKSGGWCSSFRNQYLNSTDRGGIGCPNAYCGSVGAGQTNITQVDTYGFNYWWRVAGYQQVVTGIRALSATNVIQCNPLSFASQHSSLSQYFPTDTLSPPQLCAGMHSYQSSGVNFPATGDSGSGTSSWATYVNENIAGTGGIGYAIPVCWTEVGDTSGIGSGPSAAQPDPFMTYMDSWYDGKTAGQVGSTDWSWDNIQPYGMTGQTNWADTIYGAPISITASSSGTTLTVTSGSGLAVGMAVTGGNLDRIIIVALGTGTGGAGTYTLGYPVTQSSTGMNAQSVLPLNGQGQTRYNWMSAHALP